ncbi:Crp/Fnr family transcriptional regulator [uncultured Anaerofustis sp.]|uniref:Crp/Fnr family transcriptional regulator n=1 Tax=uncultured Anaerofustis sp. TaxID=904996 RepID=UPI0025FB1349|nr:Crp/Fnr family transcriptional regulator [uncultured Anaerofustis sp.]
MKKYINVLTGSILFKNIKEEQINEILKLGDFNIKEYDKNEYIYHKEDTVKKFGILLSGKASIIKEDYWGNKNIVANINKGDLFAEIFSILYEEPLNVSVVSTENSRILFINISNILNSNKSSEAINIFTKNILRIISKKTLILNKKIEYLSKRNLRDKILSFLSDQAQLNGNKSFYIPFDRQQMADFLATDRSALSRELSNIQKEGLIEYNKNHFILK